MLNALDDLIQDRAFKTSARNKRFLKFVVEETLAGRSARIKSYSIAVDVFGRSESFDAVRDPIVRIEATRLRAALEAYYAGPGSEQPLRIELPRGGYVPAFVFSQSPPPAAVRADHQPPPAAVDAADRPGRTPRLRRMFAFVGLTAVVVAAVAVGSQWHADGGAERAAVASVVR